MTTRFSGTEISDTETSNGRDLQLVFASFAAKDAIPKRLGSVLADSARLCEGRHGAKAASFRLSPVAGACLF